MLTGHFPLSSSLPSPLQVNIPGNSVVPGSELTKEPFRWDQRIFSLVIRLPASIPPDASAFPYIPSAENTAIDMMCDVTGGMIFLRFKFVYKQSSLHFVIS